MHELAGDALLTVLVVITAGALLTLAEVADPLDPRRPRHRWRSAESDARWVFLWLSVVPVAGTVAGVLPGWPAPGAAVTGSLPFVVRAAAALVVYDAVAYATHRAMHSHPRLRRWHAVHHGSRELRWWTTFRFHPADTVVSHAMPLAAVGLAGFGADAAGAAVAVVCVVTLLAHADVWFPDRLGALVTTPAVHRRHHDPASAQTHFALVLPVWDHIFGTVADRSAGQRPTNAPIARPASNEATFAIALVDNDDHPSMRQTLANTHASHSTIASSSAANPATVSVSAGHSAATARNAVGCEVALAKPAASTALPTPAPARTSAATTIGTSTTNVASSATA